MACASSSNALAAVQRFVDEHSAEFIMSLHTAAAQLHSNHGLSRRLLADICQMAQSPDFCDELAGHVAELCPSKLAEMFSRDVQVKQLYMPLYDGISNTSDITGWQHTCAVLSQPCISTIASSTLRGPGARRMHPRINALSVCMMYDANSGLPEILQGPG